MMFLFDLQEAATGVLIGDLSNPLLVLPLQPVNQVPSVRAQEPVERNEVPLGKVVGAGFQAFEDSVLDKLRKVSFLFEVSVLYLGKFCCIDLFIQQKMTILINQHRNYFRLDDGLPVAETFDV